MDNQQNKRDWIFKFFISLPFIFLGSMVLFGLLGAILKGGFWNVALTWGRGVGVLLSIVIFVSMYQSVLKQSTSNKEKVPSKTSYDMDAPAVSYSDFVKEEERYYFYNDKCSFLLPKEEIKNVTVEKGGRKFTLFTDSMAMVILEIRDGMPNFPIQVQSKQITVGGLPCLAAAVGPLAALAGGYNQYFINCRKFVVQVSLTIVGEGTMRFLNSFKLHK